VLLDSEWSGFHNFFFFATKNLHFGQFYCTCPNPLQETLLSCIRTPLLSQAGCPNDRQQTGVIAHIHQREGDPMNQIHVQVTALARQRLTEQDIEQAVTRAKENAEHIRGWKTGKTYRLNITRGETTYVVALDFRDEGYTAVVGIPQEAVLEMAN
jgi:hypothetical protein